MLLVTVVILYTMESLFEYVNTPELTLIRARLMVVSKSLQGTSLNTIESL